MKSLEEKIIKEGKILPGNILMVGGFLNQRIDVPFIYEVGGEFHRLFGDCGVTKILTVEASGIAIASLTALHFGVPVVFAKKSRTLNLSGDIYSANVHSYTHNTDNSLMVSKEYLTEDDRILVIDDFLATGNALFALLSLVKQSGATLVGMGAVIEKTYQDGGKLLRDMGIRVESLAKIKSMSYEHGIEFC